MKLGNALQTLGERESGTARLEVAARRSISILGRFGICNRTSAGHLVQPFRSTW